MQLQMQPEPQLSLYYLGSGGILGALQVAMAAFHAAVSHVHTIPWARLVLGPSDLLPLGDCHTECGARWHRVVTGQPRRRSSVCSAMYADC